MELLNHVFCPFKGKTGKEKDRGNRKKYSKGKGNTKIMAKGQEDLEDSLQSNQAIH